MKLNNKLDVYSLVGVIERANSFNDHLQEWERKALLDLARDLPKFVENYNIMLRELKDRAIPDTFCGMHEALQNEIEAEKAQKVLKKLGELE